MTEHLAPLNIIPDDLPDALQPILAQMQHQDPAKADCRAISPVLDWFYQQRWHADRADLAELGWLLAWMEQCDHPDTIEIADAVSLLKLEQGAIEESIAIARRHLTRSDDFGLNYTLALALTAQGAVDEAIARLDRVLAQEKTTAKLPAEVRIQALLDLARLQQRQGALFKALKPARTALSLAAQNQLEPELEEAARFLVQQLVAQGGTDEAWDTLKELLTPERTGLWQLCLESLESEMTTEELGLAADSLYASGLYDPIIKALSSRANRAQSHEQFTLAYVAALALSAPTDIVAPLASALLLRDEDRKAERAPLIAASAVAVAEDPTDRSIKQAQWHRNSVVQLISVAKHHGVPEAAVKIWAEDEKLYRENGVIGRTQKELIKTLSPAPDWLRDAVDRFKEKPAPLSDAEKPTE